MTEDETPAGAPTRGQRLLAHPRLGLAAALVGILLTLPSLGAGRLADDLYHRWVLDQTPVFTEVRPGPLDIFRFLDGNPARTTRMRDLGIAPWWIDPQVKGAFWRPVTALTHWVDYRLWPDRPALMHAQSIAWLALLVLVAAALYRGVMGAGAAAGLAMLLFAADANHGVPVIFLANRNALVAAFFGVLALRAHLRWRQGGGRAGALLAPALLALSLLSAEAGMGTVAYLAAAACTLDRAPWRARLASLLPYAAVVLMWRAAWAWQGYGVSAGMGELYLDPGTHPLRFAGELLRRVPLLLLGEWTLVPAELHIALSRQGAMVMIGMGAALMASLTAALAPRLRRDAAARFWAIGMLLAVVPASATAPMNRNLIFVGIGAMGLLGMLLAEACASRGWRGAPRAWRLPGMALAGGLLLIHGAVSPLALAVQSGFLSGPASRAVENLSTLPGVTEADRGRDLIVVNHPLPFASGMSVINRALDRQPLPRNTMVLAPAYSRLTVTRPDARSLVVRPQKSFFGGLFSRLTYNREHPPAPGETIRLPAATATVRELSASGEPAEVIFQFPVALEDPSLHWLCWQAGKLTEFRPPAVGQTVELPGWGVPI